VSRPYSGRSEARAQNGPSWAWARKLISHGSVSIRASAASSSGKSGAGGSMFRWSIISAYSSRCGSPSM